jgi:type IV pilus assembly protein PilQ
MKFCTGMFKKSIALSFFCSYLYVIPFFFIFHSLEAAVNLQALKFLQKGEESQLLIQTDSPPVYEKKVNVEQKTIIIDLKDTVATSKVMRSIDASEFPGALVYISAYKRPGNPNDIRIALQLRDNVLSKVDVVDGGLLVKVENRYGVFAAGKESTTGDRNGLSGAQISDEGSDDGDLGLRVPKSMDIQDILENLTMSGKKKYIGKKISVNVKNVPVIDILKMIADTSGFNIFIDEAVSAKPPMTISLIDEPWDNILDTVLMINKLSGSKYNNILTITTIEKALEAKGKMEEEDKKLKVQEPLVTKIFSINYAKPSDVVTILNDYKSEDRGKITIEQRTNKIIVKDTVTNIDKMKKIIELIDTATPQILIESKIVEVSENFSKNIGLGSLGFQYNPLSYIAGGGADSPKPGFTVNTIPGSERTALSFGIDVLRRLGNLNMTLQLLEAQSKAKIVSSPRVITQNNQPASINSSESVPYQTSSVSGGVVNNSWSSASATTTLSVTPSVNNNGSIALSVSVNKSSLAERADLTVAPGQTSNSISTNVLVDNGATVVVGGLYSKVLYSKV